MAQLTHYHAKFLATDLIRRRSADSAEKLAIAVAGAQVDMNPHQVDAALFAFSSPLIAANLRGFKGSTDVNDEIEKTIGEESNLFLYLNNGLTAYCDRLEDDNRDRLNLEKKRYTARGFSIINGAQTLGSVATVLDKVQDGQPKPEGFAFIKIISLEKCDDDRAFADRISRTANFQNHVGLKDFAAA